MTPPTALRAGRVIYLRPLTVEDMDRCVGWFNDPSVTAHLNKGHFPNTRAQQVAHFEKIHASRGDMQFGIAMVEGDELVGSIGLHHIDWIHRRGDISIVVGETSAQRRGVASEAIGLIVAHAFEKLNLHKVTAGMWVTNEGSRKAFERNGFALEATLRESFWHTERYVDEWRLGLLRSDWQRQQGRKS